MGGSCGTHGVERTGAHRGLVGISEGKGPFVKSSVEVGIILKWALKKLEGKAWTGSVRFRTGTGCRLL